MFYKYISINSANAKEQTDRIINSITNDELFFADWRKFNDIGEGSFCIDPSDVLWSTDFEKCTDELKERIIGQKKSYSILCSTTNNTHALMWALYASEHQGICIGFTPSNKMRRINVNYSRLVPCVRPKPFIEISDVDMDNVVEEILGTKSVDFSSESEVRFLLREPPGCKAVSIREVYFGCKINQQIKSGILEACRNKSLDLYDSLKLQNSYSLERKPIKLESFQRDNSPSRFECEDP